MLDASVNRIDRAPWRCYSKGLMRSRPVPPKPSKTPERKPLPREPEGTTKGPKEYFAKGDGFIGKLAKNISRG